MYVNRSIELSSENEHRFQNFIVFEPASFRVNDSDILVKSEAVRDLYERIFFNLEESHEIKDRILKNRLIKIGQMLDLLVVYDHVIITKFFDRIWRRYSYISNIGELFLDYPTFSKHFPEYKDKKSELLAQRIDDDDDEASEEEDETTATVAEPKDAKKE